MSTTTPTATLQDRKGSNFDDAAFSSSMASFTASVAHNATSLPASRSSSSSSSSSDSDNTDVWIFLGVCGAFLVAIGFSIWWCCARRNSCCRRRLRQRKLGKYGKLEEGNGQLVGATPLQNLSAGNKDELPRPSFEAESMRPPRNPGLMTYRVEHIPSDMTHDDVRNLFSSTITVKSLAPAVWPMESAYNTATIEYKESSMIGRKSIGPTLSREGKLLEINTDDRFNGFTPLNEARGPIRADLVAVTGLAGHAFGSWAHDREHNWLRDYLPKDVHNLRVMTYGYDSQLAQGQQSRQDLDMHAQDFATRLEQLWESTNYKRPTILVGHSLGCILILSALIRSRTFRRCPKNLETIVPRVIFFGAPFGGLQTVALEMLVKGTPSQTLIEDLKPGSVVLKQLTNNFKKISRNMSIMSVYERKPTPTAIKTNSGEWKREGPMMMMVDQEKACLYFDNEDTVSSQTDHKGIAKLQNSEGSPYAAVCRFIIAGLETPLERSKSVFR